MPLYESVFIARQDISQTQVEALLERFGGIVTEGGGEVGKTEYWGVRGLAYRIKKNRKGHYVMMSLDAPAPAIQEMERNMRLDEDILRYLTLKVDAFEEGASIMMQRGRDDRGRGGRRDRDDRPGRDEHRDRPPGGNMDEARTAAPKAPAVVPETPVAAPEPPAVVPEEGAATASKSEGVDE